MHFKSRTITQISQPKNHPIFQSLNRQPRNYVRGWRGAEWSFSEDENVAGGVVGEDVGGQDVGQDVGGEDVLGEDAVGEDAVGEDAIGEDVEGEDVEGENVGFHGKNVLLRDDWHRVYFRVSELVERT